MAGRGYYYRKLKSAAKESAVSLGVRRTTVDQLVAVAGIWLPPSSGD
ncbi:hypothetical protein ACRQU7_00890 [Caproiciproducens sp. R1]